jgi:hypothetical protein
MSQHISLETIRALRGLRSGMSLDQASRRWNVRPQTLSQLNRNYRNVPEQMLRHLELALSDRDRLRRLVADLVPQLRS